MMLVIFLAVCCKSFYTIRYPMLKKVAIVAAVKVSGALSSSTSQTRNSLQKQGVTYQDGKLSVKTDRAAPSRQEYIASTQRAFEKGAKTMSQHPEAFRMGPSKSDSEPVAVSSVETP